MVWWETVIFSCLLHQSRGSRLLHQKDPVLMVSDELPRCHISDRGQLKGVGMSRLETGQSARPAPGNARLQDLTLLRGLQNIMAWQVVLSQKIVGEHNRRANCHSRHRVKNAERRQAWI
jgi:hypothetical protein